MSRPSGAFAPLPPDLGVGERVSVLAEHDGSPVEVLGFVTHLDGVLGVVDRHGTEHRWELGAVVALRRVPIARGRRPESTPRDLLDALAERAGASGDCWVGRISDLLEGRRPPASVPARGEFAELGGVRARFEGEWVTLPSAPEDVVVAAAWWATRMGARSVQVRGRTAPARFTRLG